MDSPMWTVWYGSIGLAPVYEGDEDSARRMIMTYYAATADVLLESPVGDLFAYEHGEWVPADK
jgi:hypothetical protein